MRARTATALALAVACGIAAGDLGRVATPAFAQEKPPAAAPARPDLGLIRDAVAAYRRNDVPAGDAFRDKVTDPAARAFLDYAALRLGGGGISFERAAGFANAYPDFPGQAWLRTRIEGALLIERRPPATVRAFFARERPQSAAGKLALALAFRQDGLTEDAAELVRDAWRNDVFGRELESRMLDAFGDAIRPEDHRFRTERLLLRENWEGARRAASYANSGLEVLVKARIAVDQKAGNALKLVDAVPPALKRDTSWLFSRVQFLRRADKAAEAARLMEDLSRDPALLADGDAWWVERRLVARKLLDEGQPKVAYGVVVQHGATSAEKRVEAEFLAGWIALRALNDPALARKHFERADLVAATPISDARVAYWRGRAAEAAGNGDEARRFYAAAARNGTAYYGQLAAAKLGQEPMLRPAGDPQGPARRTASAVPMVGAVAVAYQADLKDLGVPLAVEFGRGGTDVAQIEAVAAIAAENRDARTVLTVGKLALARGLAVDEAAFPTIGIPSFEPVGTRVEPAMVHAIARQESMFDPVVGSPVGARGLMQLMPATAQATARKAGIEYDPGKILDGAYNARIGAAHLGDLMDDWKGSLILVFASYNAGPGNAKKWIQAHGDPRAPGVDAVDWVELIPFSETRNYVQRVMENIVVYRQRLAPQAVAGEPPGPASPSPGTPPGRAVRTEPQATSGITVARGEETPAAAPSASP